MQNKINFCPEKTGGVNPEGELRRTLGIAPDKDLGLFFIITVLHETASPENADKRQKMHNGLFIY